MRRKSAAICLLLSCLMSSAAPSARGGDEEKGNPLAPLERLIGLWEGQMTLSDGSSFTVGVEFEWGLNQKVIRYSTFTLQDGHRQAYGEGTYWWNPQAKELEFREYNAYGSASSGTIQADGDALMARWTEVTASGGSNYYKDTIRFPSPDAWTSLPYQKNGESWEKVMDPVTYQRRK